MEMITGKSIYLLNMYDNILGVLVMAACFLAVWIIVMIACAADYMIREGNLENYIFNKYIKKTLIVVILNIILLIFTPSSKTIVAMYLVPKITSNEDIQEIPANLSKLLNSKLKEWIDDLDGHDNEK